MSKVFRGMNRVVPHEVLLGVLLVIGMAGIIYLAYSVGKGLSYSIFYKGMVEETIREMVVEDALKERSGQ